MTMTFSKKTWLAVASGSSGSSGENQNQNNNNNRRGAATNLPTARSASQARGRRRALQFLSARTFKIATGSQLGIKLLLARAEQKVVCMHLVQRVFLCNSQDFVKLFHRRKNCYIVDAYTVYSE